MRKVAREVAFKLIYEYLFLNEKRDFHDCELIKMSNLDESDMIYLGNVYNGVIDNIQVLKEEIQKHAIGYKIDRIYKIDISILLLAAFEILHVADVPRIVAINEAVELSKLYSTKKSGSFINGILGKINGDMNES